MSDLGYSGIRALRSDFVAVLFASEDGHVQTRVFRLQNDRVKEVLQIWGYGDPDFVEGYMLISTGRTMKGDCILPNKTEIYSANATQLQLVKTVPYEDRFKALSRIVQAAETRQTSLPCCGAPGCPE